MNYPLITEYIEAIKDAGESFDELSHLRPVLGNDGAPVMSSGNFAVVFKMEDPDSGKLYAVKCFTREQEGRDEAYRLIADELAKVDSPYLTPIRFLERELFVDSRQTPETEFPVLLMDWVEGQTLASVLFSMEKTINENASYWTSEEEQVALFELRCLPLNFIRMASWLIKQPFAHGDLKPDNIMVTQNGTFVLVDYDGMYVPSMQGMIKQCAGSPNYRHPKERNWDKTLDNYAISVMALSLYAFALRPQRILNSNEYCVVTEDNSLKLFELDLLKDKVLMSDDLFKELIAIYFHVISQNTLTAQLFDDCTCDFLLPRSYDVKYTSITDFEQEHYWEDKYGVRYSLDGRKVLKASKDLKEIDYHIRDGVLTICDQSFQNKGLKSVILPNSIIAIGDRAFANNDDMEYCNIPRAVQYIFDNNPWGGCYNIKHMDCFSPLFKIDDGILYSSNYSVVYGFIYWHEDILINPKAKKISANAFWSSRKNYDSVIKNVNLSNVLELGRAAFFNCCNARFVIPESLAIIGEDAFYNCCNLREIKLSILRTISEGAFEQCDNLTRFEVINEIEIIQKNAFRGCERLACFNIPKSTIYISEDAFENCTSLQNFIVDNNNSSYCDIDGVLFNKSITKLIKYPSAKPDTEYIIPSSVIEIADEAFAHCVSLKSIICKQDLICIGNHTFNECTNLTNCSIKLMDNADKDSFWNLGSYLLQLKEASSDTKDLAYTYIDKAANLEQPSAQLYLAKCFKSGWHNNIVDNNKYIYWLKRAAANEDQYEGKLILGMELTIGEFIPTDYNRAYKLFSEIEDAGLFAEIECDGMHYCYLGLFYELGIVVNKDFKKAAEYYEEGVGWNDSLAEYNLAKLYENGLGVNRDLFKAKELYLKAKEHKLTDATEALARVERLIEHEEPPF